MATEIEDNEIMLRCSCGDHMEHVVWLIHDNDDHEHPCWYLMTGLDGRFGFWRRVWTGLRYAFRPDRLRYYGYSEAVLLNADMNALVAFINKRRALG